MEESNHGISMKEEEYQRQSREELAHEKMKTIRMKSKIVELDDQVLKYKSLYNEINWISMVNGAQYLGAPFI